MVLMLFYLYFVVVVTNISYHNLEYSLDHHPDQTQQLQGQLSAFSFEIQLTETVFFQVLNELVPEHLKIPFVSENTTIIEMAKLKVFKANL